MEILLYSAADDNYQAATVANSIETITSPSFTGPGGTLTVGARLAPSGLVADFTITIVENSSVIACFDRSG